MNNVTRSVLLALLLSSCTSMKMRECGDFSSGETTACVEANGQVYPDLDAVYEAHPNLESCEVGSPEDSCIDDDSGTVITGINN